MTEPHTKWLDLSDRELVDWGINYLNKRIMGPVDKWILELVKFSGSRKVIREVFGSTEDFLTLRRNMENAWRVRCSRKKNLRINPKYVAISNSAHYLLKDLGWDRGISESGALNYLIKNTATYKRKIEEQADKKIKDIEAHYKENLDRAKDKSQTIARKKLIAKALSSQKIKISHLQKLVKELKPWKSKQELIGQSQTEEPILNGQQKHADIAPILDLLCELEVSNLKIHNLLDPHGEL